MSKFVQCFVKSKTGKPKITQISFSFGIINIFRSHLNAIHITLISIYMFSNVNGFWKIWHKISEYLRRLLAWEWEISYSFHILGTRTTNNICSQTILALSFNESSMKIYTHTTLIVTIEPDLPYVLFALCLMSCSINGVCGATIQFGCINEVYDFHLYTDTMRVSYVCVWMCVL